jgi:hypothetical protein
LRHFKSKTKRLACSEPIDRSPLIRRGGRNA